MHQSARKPKNCRIYAGRLVFDSTAPAVRAAAVQGVALLVENPIAQPLLKSMLPSIGRVLWDASVNVRAAFSDLLIAVQCAFKPANLTPFQIYGLNLMFIEHRRTVTVLKCCDRACAHLPTPVKGHLSALETSVYQPIYGRTRNKLVAAVHVQLVRLEQQHAPFTCL